MTRNLESRFYQSQDGLRLHYLDARPDDDGGRLPVVCLPGLTRGAEDFTSLAKALAFDAPDPRRVVAFDYRGRGLSQHDPDWHHYDLATERADVLDGLADAGIERAHFVGTSRGGLHLMALAARHKERMAAIVLNDIGPVLEPGGLRRIKGYVGRQVTPSNVAEAIRLLKIGNGDHFDGLSEPEWRIFALTTFGSDENDLRLRYDPALARTLDAFDLDKPLPDSWELFDLLRGTPILTLRGSNSDLLSSETLTAMGARWPESETFVVEGQGHAPILADAASIDRIRTFFARAS